MMKVIMWLKSKIFMFPDIGIIQLSRALVFTKDLKNTIA